MPRPRPLLVHAAAVAALLALTACGTTVPLAQQAAAPGAVAPGATGDGLSGGAGGAGGADETGVGGAASGAGGAGDTADGSVGSGDAGSGPGAEPAPGTAGPAPAGGAGAAAAPVAGRPAPGAPAAAPVAGEAPVEVGFFVSKDLGPATEALGVEGLATGDGRAQALATVELLNRRGGLAGHPVEPVVFEYDPSGNASTQFQAACALFFDDHDVRAVVSLLLQPLLRQCTAAAGVPFVSSGNRTSSATELGRHPLTAVAPVLSLDRFVPAFISSLRSQGFFEATSRVGLLYNDEQDYAGVPALVEAQLRRFGVTLADEAAMPGTDDTSRVTAATSAGQNAALRFAAARVDRVLVVDKSGQALAYFGIAAQGQGYYPRYGLSSMSLPNALRTVLSARSLRDAAGIGWSPALDLPVRSQPVVSPTGAACLAAMEEAGEDMGATTTRIFALSTCEGALVLAAAWKDPALSPSTFLPGLRALGRSFPPALTFATDFTRRVDGASQFRPLAFDAACDCFTYRGPAQSAG